MGSVQEEVGLRGARVATARVRPQIGLAIDITLANDGPDAKPHERVTTVGGGAAVKVYDAGAIVPRAVVDHLVAVGEERGHRDPARGAARGQHRHARARRCRATAPPPAACRSRPATCTRSSSRCHPDDLDACVALVVAFCETAHSLVE